MQSVLRVLREAAAVLVVFVVLSGWRPYSRESTSDEVTAAEAASMKNPTAAACWTWPYATVDAILLQRRQYLP